MPLAARIEGFGLPSSASARIAGDVQRNVTAAGTTQSDAYQLSYGETYVATTPSGSGVKLAKMSVVGDSHIVYNYGANTLSVYPPLGDTIAGLTVNQAVSLPAGSDAKFQRIAPTDWVVSQPSTSAANSTYTPSGSGATVRTVQAKLRETLSFGDFGVTGSGSDESTAMQAAIDAANVLGAANNATVVLRGAPGLTYTFNSSLTLKSFVEIDGNGALFKWGGSTTGTMFDNASTGVIRDAGLVNVDIDATALTGAGIVLKTRSPYQCVFRDIYVNGASTTSFVLDIAVNTSGTKNPGNNYNAVFNSFENIVQNGTCGTLLRTTGDVTTPTVVTLNSFRNLHALSCAVRGIEFVNWTDNNYFAGMTRVSITANNGVGVEFNTGTPASNVGVYANCFDLLAVDTLGSLTGRIGLKLNNVSLIVVGLYYNSPAAEGGTITTSSTASYRILQAPAATQTLRIAGKNDVIAFRAKISSAQTFTGAKTQADFANEVFDIAGAYDGTNTFTAPVDGVYVFDVTMTNTTGVTVADVWLLTIEAAGSLSQVNGSPQYTIANALGGCTLKGSARLSLVAGDTVKVYVTRNSGSGNYVQLNDGSYTYFTGMKLQ